MINRPLSIRVLLIDDNSNLRFVLRLRLENLGFEVLEAEDGKTGVQLAIEHQPTVILLDFEMPGMDGLEAASLLKENKKTVEIPIILLSSAPFEQNWVVQLNLIGVEAFLMKPYDFEKLRKILFRYLGHIQDAGLDVG